jgi:hypothetical protein
MANWVIVRIDVRGAGRGRVRERFEGALKPDGSIPVWDFGAAGWMRYDADHGDGVTDDGTTLSVRGSSNWRTPLNVARVLFEEFPDVEIVISGCDPIGGRYDKWKLEGGQGYLVDCLEPSGPESWGTPDYQETVYMRDGVQLLTLPDWIEVADKEMPRSEGPESGR